MPARQSVFAITIRATLPVPGKDAQSLASAAGEMLKIIPALATLGLEDIAVENKLASRAAKPTVAPSPDGIPITATLVFDDRTEVVTGTLPVSTAAQLSEIRTSVQAAAGMTGATGTDPDRPAFLNRQKGA